MRRRGFRVCSPTRGWRRRRREGSASMAVGGRRWWRRWRGYIFAMQLLLLLPQKVDDKLLVVLDEVVRQALVLQILAKMLPPKRVERIQQSEF